MEKWQPWEFQLDLFDILNIYDLIYILKASQLGISWELAIYNLWLAISNETSRELLLSQGQVEAYELLDKVAFIHDHLPDYMKLPARNLNRERLTFKDNFSQVRALPSTEKAGHGFQGSLVTRDELARHEYARENFKAVARAGGKLVELSTANKEDSSNYFQEKTEEYYRDPKSVKRTLKSGLQMWTNEGRPGTCLVFLPWNLRPTRYEGLTLDEWWNSRILPRFTPQEIEEQYPATIDDVFKALESNTYFSVEHIADMEYDICAPIKQNVIDHRNHLIRVYKPPDLSRRYVLFTDPSDGQEDPFVTGVMDYVTGEIVCTASGMLPVAQVAEVHDYLTRQYVNATNSYEYNAVGMAFAVYMDNMNTPSQAPRRKTDGTPDLEKRGQFVSEKHKRLMFADLAKSIVSRSIIIHDREFFQQAKLVQRDFNGYPVTDPKTKGKWNRPFDWVMMMNGLVQLSKYAPRGTASFTTYKANEDGKYVLAR